MFDLEGILELYPRFTYEGNWDPKMRSGVDDFCTAQLWEERLAH